MMLTLPKEETVERFNVRDGETLRLRFIEYLQTEHLRLLRRCSMENIDILIHQVQGACMALDELVTILKAAPAHNQPKKTPGQQNLRSMGAQY